MSHSLVNQTLLNVLYICLFLRAVLEDSIENFRRSAAVPHPPPVLNISHHGRQNDPYYYVDDGQNIYY